MERNKKREGGGKECVGNFDHLKIKKRKERKVERKKKRKGGGKECVGK